MKTINTTITEACVLPSLGKIYKEEIDPNITLRTMTTAEEMQRMSNTEYPYRTMSTIIKNCMMNDVPINPYDMCMGDYLFLLHKLRIVTYGPKYNLSSTCPYCGHSNEDEIDLNDLLVKTFKDEILDLFEFDLPQSKVHVKIKYQTPRMLDIINDKVKNFQKKSTDKNLNMQLAYTISSLIEEIDGEKVDRIELEEWAKNLPMLDTQTIMVYSDAINNSIGFDRRLEAICDICKLSYNTSFRTTSEFFRPTINIRRQRL